MQTIELLAPARDAECGFEAIRHGADAVYIGGPSFGARAAAGNTVEDIARLANFAHLYGARVYVTLNTILYDNELADAEALVWQLWRAGVDALIVQDAALLAMHLPPIALHASTQMDNCTPERAQWLEAAGFRQIVVAREMSLGQIRRMASSVNVPIEAFVHGALCVSYSGRCYASEYCFHRSANRGCCAQFCRLAFDLVDDRGRVWVHDRHLLSLRDMNRTASLEEMMDAGVRSFKIEGRLKDAAYVKNVTAHYRRHIDEVLARRAADYRRSSYGTSQLTFTPDASRSFNRGFTDYFLHGRTAAPISTPGTPKATGPVIGRVDRLGRRDFTYTPAPDTAPVTAGDGLCFIGPDGRLQGFRVNKAEGNRLTPATRVQPQPGTVLHRSLDFALDKVLARPTGRRTLSASLTLRETPQGYALDLSDESGCHVSCGYVCEHAEARSPQRAAMERTLTKTGDTPFSITEVHIKLAGERFIPASQLADWRRQTCEALERCHRMSYQRDRAGHRDEAKMQELQPEQLTYAANVANHTARSYLLAHGARTIAPAFEQRVPDGPAVLMTCRHCIRHELGQCLQEKGSRAGQLFLRLPDGRTFPLHFDCRHCEMQVMKPEAQTPPAREAGRRTSFITPRRR